MITETEINQVYDELLTTKKDYEEKAMAFTDAKANLESMFASDLASGIITGKNEVERKGQFEERYPDLVDALRTRSKYADEARLRLDLAGIKMGRITALLRLAEVLVAQEASNGLNVINRLANQ